MHELTLPRLSDSMDEATVVAWLCSEGGDVTAGSELVEVETDKATTTIEADVGGVLLKIVAGEGESVSVGAPLALIGEETEREIVTVAAGETRGSATEPTVERAAGAGRLLASPVARRRAAAHGISLSEIEGTGRGGRILKSDVEAEMRRLAAADAGPPAARPEPATDARGEARVLELSRAEQLAARRMAESKASAPDFHLETVVALDLLAAARERIKAEPRDELPVPTVNDFVVKAAAIALREMPQVNSSFVERRRVEHGRVNVGVAVAGQGGLIVPTLFDADRASVGQIAAGTRQLVAAARSGTLRPSDLEGGTFTVSNLGMFGVSRFTAVINPPQAAILAVGAAERTPVVGPDGGVAPGVRMRLTLGCDHRVLDGATGAAFLSRVRDLLEEPLGMAL